MVQERLEDLAGLRQLLAGGDALSVSHCRRIRERLPHIRLINGYGPTETTTFACCHTVTDVPANAIRVPIGTPIAGTTVYVLDRDRKLTNEGELYIGGAGLARGYWNRPELTAERFVMNPFDPETKLYRTGDRVRQCADGALEFLGRLDNQVKIRGFRIEPGEVEAAILHHPDVSQAVVICEDESGEKRLIAYVVPDVPELREFLRERLPAFMLPAQIVALSELPLTSNGKVDRQRLPKTAGTSPAARHPRAPIHDRLPPFGTSSAAPPDVRSPKARRFADGLNSCAIEREFGRELSVDAIMNGGSVRQLAGAERARTRNAKCCADPAGGRGRRYTWFTFGQVMGFRTLAKRLGLINRCSAWRSAGADERES